MNMFTIEIYIYATATRSYECYRWTTVCAKLVRQALFIDQVQMKDIQVL